MNILSVFEKTAEKQPAYIAIVEGSSNITFQELQSEAAKTASYFHRKGISKGDRVMVFVPMGIDLYRILLALFSIGAVAVFVDEWVNKKRLRQSCNLAQVKGFVGVSKSMLLRLFIPEIRRVPVKLSLHKKDSKPFKTANLDDDHPALITFTTGSIGAPKAAERSHGFLLHQFKALSAVIEPQPNDVDMTTLPIVLLLNLGAGSTSVIAKYNSRKPKSFKPNVIANQITTHGITRISTSPYVLNTLAEYCLPTKTHFPLLKKSFTGGAPVYPSDASRICLAFPNTEITILYGSTEVEPISVISAKELSCQSNAGLKDGLLVGCPVNDLDVKIIRWEDKPFHEMSFEQFENLGLENEKIGEIVVKGNHVMKKYFNSTRAFQRNKIVVNEDVWHRTGDSGYLKAGELFLTGRCTQLIQNGETFISPFQIESLLQEVRGVSIGTVLEINNYRILALEVPNPNINLGDIAIPVEFDRTFILSSIPRDPRHNSKIDYEALKAKIGCKL